MGSETLEDRIRRLESALAVAEEALRGSEHGARLTGMHHVAEGLREALVAIEKIKGGV